MAGGGRAIAGVAVTVAVALVLFLALRGHGGAHPPAAAGTAPGGAVGTPQSATGAPGLVPAASAQPSSAAAPAMHADPLSGAAASYAAGRSGTVLAAVYDVRDRPDLAASATGRRRTEASVVKLDILETLLARPATARRCRRPDQALRAVDDRGQRQRRGYQPVGRGRRGGGASTPTTTGPG